MTEDVDAIHDGERIPTLEAIGRQAGEMHDEPTPSITCPCGASGPIDRFFRCFYCEVFFCPSCAEDHFE